MNPLVVVFLILCLCPITIRAELPDRITLGGTDWCPYTCTASHGDLGIVPKYLHQILADKGIELTVRIMPWSRAIREANAGNIDGLITAVVGEAPELLLTSTPTMTYQDCFYTKKMDSWTYNGVDSLATRTLAAIQDYGYSPTLDAYLANHKGNVVLISGDNVQKRLHNMLTTGRVDTFIAEKRVHRLSVIKADGALRPIRQTTCLPETPFYLAIQPSRPWSKQLVDFLNQALATEAAQNKRQSLVTLYYQEMIPRD